MLLTFALLAACGEREVMNSSDTTVEKAETDPLLGEPFRVYPIASHFLATLIEYPFEISEGQKLKGLVLYIHGYNDYFFQKELAQKTDSAGYAFFAIDLHNYGRSLQRGDTIFEVDSLEDYDAELDSAVLKMKSLVPSDSATANLPIFFIGHSTGGLIATLYANRYMDKVDAIVLNSPFFEMNMVWPMRKIVIPFLSKMGEYFPKFSVNESANPNYGKSLLRSEFGDWDFDVRLKKILGPEKDLGWIRAIHLGHSKVQQGLNLKIPVLVMHSGCSIRQKEWTEEYTRCDGVLNVKHIEEIGAKLGPKVTLHTVENGLHDLYLSRKIARDDAYQATFHFFDSNLK